MPVYIRSSFSALGTLSARSRKNEQIRSTVHSSILWSYRDESDLPVFTMYQFNLAKDLKEHKTFPLNLKSTTDLKSHQNYLPAGGWLSLFPCQQDSWALRLMTTGLHSPNSCITQICCWTWLFHSDRLQKPLSRTGNLTTHDFFWEYFYHQGKTMPVITISFMSRD